MGTGLVIKHPYIFAGAFAQANNMPAMEVPAAGIKNPLTGVKVKFDGKEEEKNEEIKKNIRSGKRSELYRKRKLTAAVLLIFLVASIVFTGGVLLVLNFIDENSMKITVYQSWYDVLSVYDNLAFKNPTTSVSIDGPEKMDNITYEWLPDDIDSVDGSHNGKNYIAFTFYIRNNGKIDIEYRSEIVINKLSRQLDSAVRVMVISNGERAVYAKAKENGEAEMVSSDPLNMAVPFSGASQVMESASVRLNADSYDKYTIAVWLEGEDPDCVNKVLGGTIAIEMKFEVMDKAG